ncbi:hypothetical protein ACVWWN_007552 [Mycobacterium sp. URHB0021]|jgi:hypothetical protein
MYENHRPKRPLHEVQALTLGMFRKSVTATCHSAQPIRGTPLRLMSSRDLSTRGDTAREETTDDDDASEHSGACRLASLGKVVAQIG